MATEAILEKLNALEESPWADLRGKELDARGLASRLRKYEVKPQTVRLDAGHTAKGYRREDLADLWSRYLSPSGDSADTSDTTSQPRSAGSESVTDEDLFVTNAPSHVTDSNPPNDAQRDGVTDVSDKSQNRAPSNGHRPPCTVCGEPMILVETGQTTHPSCDAA